jgi:Recombination endonuclease VII
MPWCRSSSKMIIARDLKGQYTHGRRIVNQYGWSIYFTETHKECRKCKEIKLHSEFSLDKKNKYGTCYWCKICAASNARKHHHRRMKEDSSYPESKKANYVKGRHGIVLEEYKERLATQNYECAICRVKLPAQGHQTHLDHCHKTGKLRAFLCTNCNRGLGHFKDSVENLSKAINYLNTHNSSVDTIEKDIIQ